MRSPAGVSIRTFLAIGRFRFDLGTAWSSCKCTTRVGVTRDTAYFPLPATFVIILWRKNSSFDVGPASMHFMSNTADVDATVIGVFQQYPLHTCAPVTRSDPRGQSNAGHWSLCPATSLGPSWRTRGRLSSKRKHSSISQSGLCHSKTQSK